MTIVIEVRPQGVHYSYFRFDTPDPVLTQSHSINDHHNVDGILRQMQFGCDQCREQASDGGAELSSEALVIALRIPFGGQVFKQPTWLDAAALDRLAALIPQAPMHLPMIVALGRKLLATRPNAPCLGVFDTGFFADLPVREANYAINAELANSMQLRRYGYQGILHEAACRRVMENSTRTTQRVLSIVLNSLPELAAVVDGRPLMVTGGATPLEGLPGERSCGDVDPSIVLALARENGLGLESINDILTRQSGLLGLVGEPIALAKLFQEDQPEYKLARDVFRYRLLLACGAGVAAMGGVDAIVFSGTYHAVGDTLGPWLRDRLPISKRNGQSPIGLETFAHNPQLVIAEIANKVAEVLH